MQKPMPTEPTHDLGDGGAGRVGVSDGVVGDGARDAAYPVTYSDADNERDFMPGSLAALRAGCACAVVANDYGAGAPGEADANGPRYYTSAECPLHGDAPPCEPYTHPNAREERVAAALTIALGVLIALWAWAWIRA